MALTCGQILAYGMNVDPGKEATSLYFTCFKSVVQEFEQEFVNKVIAHRNWLVQKHKAEEEPESEEEVELDEGGLGDFFDDLGD